jgi:siroheme decarboxylase
MPLDPLDQQLLNVLQTQIPFVARPFAQLADQLHTTEADLLARIQALKGTPEKRGIIRQISAIFDSKSLGYHSTLVAARIDEDVLDAAAAIINRHPGVSHNYRRNHAFNLWYTLAVPPDSALGLQQTLAILHEQSGSHSTRMLPTLRLFKIGVKFDMTADADSEAPAASSSAPAYTEAQREIASARPLTATDKEMIRILQQDLPIVAEPYALLAQRTGVSVDVLLAAAQEFLDRRLMRRFSAVLRHREAGISANAMGVWAAPAEQTESFGTTAAGYPAVSHCYLRQSYPDWPYNIFTMVHAPTQAQCEAVLAAISAATGVKEYAALYSTKEYKKVRVQYFTPDVSQWESGYAGKQEVGELP